MLSPQLDEEENVTINDDIEIDLNHNNQNGDDGRQEENLVICGRNLNVTSSQLITIALLTTYFLLTSCYYSLLAPFLPGEAVKKGLSKTQVGFIFSIFEVVLLFLTPFFGKYVNK
jgi:hypothetical protein